jgi:hypothetical protein
VPAQSFALYVLSSDEVLTVLFTNLINGQDVGMIERGSGVGFTLEAAEVHLVLCQSSRKQFDGDLATEAGVIGEVDLSHAALADRGANLIAA